MKDRAKKWKEFFNLEKRATLAEAEIERLRAALQDMLLFFGNPSLDEWMNRPAWEEAKQVCANAEAALQQSTATKSET